MNKKQIRSAIDERLAQGHPKTAIFQALSGQGLSDWRLADLMATRPHPVLLQRHAGLIKAQVGIAWAQLVLVLLVCLWAGLKTGGVAGLIGALLVLALVGGFMYLFVWGFQRNRAWAYTATLVLGIINLPKVLMDLPDAPAAGSIGLMVALGLLGFTWHVRSKLFPDLTAFGPRKLDGEYRFARVEPLSAAEVTAQSAGAVPAAVPADVPAVSAAPAARAVRAVPTRSLAARLRLAFLLVLLALVCFGAWVSQRFPNEVREYRLHFTTERPEAQFHIGFLSDEWTEDDLRKQLGWLQFRCQANRPGQYLDERSCFADIRSYNRVPAMTASFYFAQGKLNRAALQLPSWEHEGGLTLLFRMLGKPQGAQARASAGVRLVGWQLDNGGAVYYNRDRPLNPLERNGIFWVSPRHCQQHPCFSSPKGK